MLLKIPQVFLWKRCTVWVVSSSDIINLLKDEITLTHYQNLTRMEQNKWKKHFKPGSTGKAS